MCPVINRFMQPKGAGQVTYSYGSHRNVEGKKKVKDGDGEMGKGKEHQNLSTFWWD